MLEVSRSKSHIFEGWITQSTGYITIQWIGVNKTNHAISWKVIYSVNSAIHLSNSPVQIVSVYSRTFTNGHLSIA